ncbi:MAG: protein translocase subunit SecD [Dehalococcoidia bacterium]|nr:protein translocase subunit SecD [Dehalococcoidia bacterium]
MLRSSLRRLIIIAVLLAVAIVVLAIPSWDVGPGPLKRGSEDLLGLRLGLDLRGGVHLVYEAQGENVTKDQMDGVASIIERRINAFGVAEPNIQVLGNNRILVQLPGVENINEAKKLIGDTARLDFKERVCQDPACSTFQDQDVGLTGDRLSRAFPGRDGTTGRPVVHIEFDSKGADTFAEVTSRISSKSPNVDRIAIFLDDRELLAPVAREAITGGRAVISGAADFTTERVRTIAIQLESGRLPVPVQVIQEQGVDATLGADSLKRSLVAAYVGLGLVVLFMVLYYRLPGVLASLALLVYVALVLAVFKLIPITLSIAGVAGLVLSIGMAVDANVLIFERMKEELRSGRSLVASVDSGYARAWTSIRDSNISTFITCFVLYLFGSRLGASAVTGFAVTLFIGVALSMFSAIFVSRTFLRGMAAGPLGRKLGLFRIGPEPARAPATGLTAGRS